MARIDHINNPNAPQANSIVPSAVAFIQNKASEILLIQRSDNLDWALPGGAQDYGERISTTAIRETKEETGIDIEVSNIIGIYTDPNHLIEYSDGEVRQQFSISFRAHVVGGTLRTSAESLKVDWIPCKDLDSLSINQSMRLRITHGLQGNRIPYIG